MVMRKRLWKRIDKLLFLKLEIIFLLFYEDWQFLFMHIHDALQQFGSVGEVHLAPDFNII